jgi:hypothetical protein
MLFNQAQIIINAKAVTFYLLMVILNKAFSQNKAIEELTKLNQDWLNSYPKKDTAALNKILSEDFILISPKETKMTRSDVINNLNKQEAVSVNIDSINVQLVADNAGLITAYTTFVLKTGDGKEMTGRNCYQDVYIKRNGRWLAVAAHVTLPDIK